MKNQNQRSELQDKKNIEPDSEAKDNQIVSNAYRALDIGSIMIAVLMQHDGVRIVEEIIKVVRKMKAPTFACKQLLDFSFDNIKKHSLLTLTNSYLSDLDKELKLKQRQSDKQMNNQTIQIFKDKMIEDIVQELYNARQIAQKLDQTDLSQSSSSNQEQHSDPDKEMKDYFTNLVKKQSEVAQASILQFKKTITNLQNENKIQKKLLQDSTKTILQKQQKISSLKNTISKLQEHIIRQVKLQGQNQMKISSNQATMMSQQDKNGLKNKMPNQQMSLIKSEALERQVIQLKKQIQGLKIDLHKSAQTANLQNKQLLNVSKKIGYNEELEREKQTQFMALSREYALVKQQVSLLINDRKSKTQIENTHNVSSDSHYDSQNDNCITLMAELQIANEKCKKLEKVYTELKQQYDKLLFKEPPITKKQSQMSIPSGNEFGEGESEVRFANNRSEAHNRQKYKKLASPSNKRLSQTREAKKTVGFASDDEFEKQQIMRDLKQINRMEGAFSESISITSFASLINPSQMATKIRGFDYANSIIHKISSSKFIQAFESKISFILQYTCLLELYFNKNFLSCIREQLMMQDTINIKPLSADDLNPTHFIYSQAASNQQNSFTSNSSKMSSSSNKMFINNQFSISQFAHTLSHLPKKGEEPSHQMAESIISLPNMGANRQRSKKLKLQRLQNQFKQISSLIPSQYLNPRELRDDPQFVAQVQKLRHNGIAQMIASLMKQNQVFKKCLNQMIKNQQNFSKLNNQIYFDQDGQLRRRSSGSNLKHQQGDKQKQNCFIM